MINGGRVDAGSICLTGVDMQKGFSRRRNLDPSKCKRGFQEDEKPFSHHQSEGKD